MPTAVADIIMPTKPTIIEPDMDKLEEILRRVEAKELHADDYGTEKGIVPRSLEKEANAHEVS